MQHVTAFSRPQTVPAVPAARSRPNLWILNSWRDLIFYVGTPLLILPVFALAQSRWSPQDIFPFRRRFRRDGTSPPGNDPSIRRPRLIRALSLALHFCPALSPRDLCRLLLV